MYVNLLKLTFWALVHLQSADNRINLTGLGLVQKKKKIEHIQYIWEDLTFKKTY